MNKTEYFAGCFGFLQLSMQDVDLLDKYGVPIKKKLLPTEADALAVYKWLSDQIKDVPARELRKMASVTDERVGKLINEDKTVNNFLLGLLLLRAYLDEEAPKHEQLMVLPKIHRLIDLVDSAVSDEEFDADIKKATARVADNLFRQAVGKLQLSDEVRDAKFKRILGRST